jgi:hypothetical protein
MWGDSLCPHGGVPSVRRFKPHVSLQEGELVYFSFVKSTLTFLREQNTKPVYLCRYIKQTLPAHLGFQQAQKSSSRRY